MTMKTKLITLAIISLLSFSASAATYDDLINSAKMGDTRDVAQMVQRGASVDSTDAEGNTLLILAAR